MKTVRTAEELRRLALATGAEVVVNGKPFNAARAKVAPAPKPTLVPPAPMPEPTPEPAEPPAPREEMLTRNQVEAMIAAHNRNVTEQLAGVLREVRAAPAAPARSEPRQWDFQVTYDANHAITHITAKAKP